MYREKPLGTLAFDAIAEATERYKRPLGILISSHKNDLAKHAPISKPSFLFKPKL